MDPAQSWCLQCGAGAPGSLGGTPGWRSATAVFGAVAVLVVGAAVAAYAALNEHSTKTPVKTLALAPAKTPATAPATTPGVASTTTPGKAALPASGSSIAHPASKTTLPTGSAKPPKLPAVSSTPESSGSTEGEPSSSSKSPVSESKSETEGKTGTKGKPSPIVLPTKAATTYNPYNYPASEFGNPRLAIDGNATTAWTAQINPSMAPKMAEGLLVNLKESKSVAQLSLVTATPGMTVQIFATKGKTIPTTITSHQWVMLSNSVVVKNRKATIKLRDASKSFRYVLLWIPKAPEGLVGTPEAPASVDLNELVLYAPLATSATTTPATTTPAK